MNAPHPIGQSIKPQSIDLRFTSLRNGPKKATTVPPLSERNKHQLQKVSNYMGATPKMVGFPNKPMGTNVLKMIILGCEMGVPPFEETPISEWYLAFPIHTSYGHSISYILIPFSIFSYDILFWEVITPDPSTSPLLGYLWIQRLHWVYHASSPGKRRRGNGDWTRKSTLPRKVRWQWKNNHLSRCITF